MAALTLLLLVLVQQGAAVAAQTPSPSASPAAPLLLSSTETFAGAAVTMSLPVAESATTYLLSCPPITIAPSLRLEGRGLYGARVVNQRGDLALDRVGLLPDPAFPELAANASLQDACPGVGVTEFATFDENGLLFMGPVDACVLQSCLARATFTILQPEPGVDTQPRLGPRRLLIEAFAGPNGASPVSVTVAIDVGIPVAPCVRAPAGGAANSGGGEEPEAAGALTV